ncbi:hypothetical protein L1987_56323 [Smallanthus sonchifolius]|uniref:Uncharacterized protein n=1 Tax=Smallanthus sonchifolius TaxID=185202 RepID=A0ACB9ECI1_9ASTR|nr:hypothetical protein L1987_56323 [Smallanthus sonchifolius]
MTSPTVFSTASAINSHLSTTNNRLISPMSLACSPTARNTNNNISNLPHRIKSLATYSMATIDYRKPAFDSEEEENPVKIGARVRVKVSFTVYHIPKVPEVELKVKEGRIKENVAVWKGKHISANFPFKIEFLGLQVPPEKRFCRSDD